MSRTAIPLRVDDLSPFAKTLRQQVAGHEGTPTHVELLNMLARAARYFDANGVLTSWPSRFKLQTLCQWVFWSRVPRGEVFTERQIAS